MTDLDRLIAAVEAGEKMDALLASRECLGLHDRRNLLKAADGSLDAALALKEALLPGWKWGAHEPKPGTFRAYVSRWSALRIMPFTEEAPTPARALLLATLRAYRDTQETKE